MKTYIEELDNLWEQMRIVIIDKVETIGTESQTGFKTIQLNPTEFESDVNLGDEWFLTEIGADFIFDTVGHQYPYGVLTHQQLAELVDYIINL